MDDLIDKQDAIDMVQIWHGIDVSETLDRLVSVEVVRCKDCRHKVLTTDGEYNPDDIVCSLWESDGFCADDYCSRGERRTDAD